MSLLRVKRGEIGVDETIKWIIWIAILAATVFAVRMIVLRVVG